MRVLCAWCCRDGQPGYLGERAPLDNPEPTHGVCARHKAQLLESLPSRSLPDADLLIVVHRDNIELYEKFKRVFAAVSRIKVILDRRVADRRTVPGQESDDDVPTRMRPIAGRIGAGAVPAESEMPAASDASTMSDADR